MSFFKVETPILLLSPVLVTVMVSVLISVGVSNKELSKRLGEYHDDIAEEQRDILETLKKEVSLMQMKQKEVLHSIKIGLILVSGREAGD